MKYQCQQSKGPDAHDGHRLLLWAALARGSRMCHNVYLALGPACALPHAVQGACAYTERHELDATPNAVSWRLSANVGTTALPSCLAAGMVTASSRRGLDVVTMIGAVILDNEAREGSLHTCSAWPRLPALPPFHHLAMHSPSLTILYCLPSSLAAAPAYRAYMTDSPLAIPTGFSWPL